MTHPYPQGLEIRTREHAEIIKFALRADKFAPAWAEVLEKIVRNKRGPRPKNPTNSAKFEPFYRLVGGQNCRDRLLLKLRKHRSDLLQEVADGMRSANGAANEGGLLVDAPSDSVTSLVARARELPTTNKIQFMEQFISSLNSTELGMTSELVESAAFQIATRVKTAG